MKAFYYRLLGEDNPLLRYPELYDAALNEFALKDFEDASLNVILDKAKISKGSLYHNFGDKFGLYLAMTDLIVKKKIAFFSEALKNDQGQFDFFYKVKQLIKATIGFMRADERLYQVLNRNLEASEEFRRQLIDIFPHDPALGFDALVRKALTEGQLDNRYPPEFISSVFGILLKHIHRLKSHSSADDIENVAERLVDFMQSGIAKK